MTKRYYTEGEKLNSQFEDYFNHSDACDNRKMMISSVSTGIEVEKFVKTELNQFDFLKFVITAVATLDIQFGDYFIRSRA